MTIYIPLIISYFSSKYYCKRARLFASFESEIAFNLNFKHMDEVEPSFTRKQSKIKKDIANFSASTTNAV